MENLYISLLLHPFPKQALVFTCLQCKPFENTAGKEEIALTMFSTPSENFPPLSSYLRLSSANSFFLKSLKFVVWERVKSASHNFEFLDFQYVSTRLISRVRRGPACIAGKVFAL